LAGAVEAAHHRALADAQSACRFLVREAGDVDGDGLSNFDESAHGPMTPEWWTDIFKQERPYGTPYPGVDWLDSRRFGKFSVPRAVAVLLVILLLFAALLALIALAPFLALVALAIKLDSRGPILYRDLRVGLGERDFGMIKFRTMLHGAEQLQDRLEQRNEASGALFKIRDDPRVTRVGALLRRYSIDEMPQVLNVLRGEMSLVGPRPLPLRDFEKLEAWHRKRYLVLPGMTGLWQISGRSELDFDDLVRLDFYYLEHWSIWLDVTILLKTVPAVIAQRGAY